MLNDIYNQTITILNKLKYTDAALGSDVWYKTVLDTAAWYNKSERTVSGSSVLIGSYTNILIPFTDKYVKYDTWKVSENIDTSFTMSLGDYIVLGTVSENITSDNISSILKNYSDVCIVKYFKSNYKRFGANVQLSIEGAQK